MNQYENVEISKLIAECRKCDDYAFDEIVRRYTPMMRKVISGFSTASLGFGELFSESCIALHSAVQSYDLEQSSVTFGLYARICVHHRLVDLVRSESAHKVSSCDVEHVADGETIESGLVKRETVEILISTAKSLLSDYEYRVLMLHIQGYKTGAIARMLSRTPKSVDNAKSRVFRRLRLALGDLSEI